ncbi:hypothetical protein ACFYNN_13020 [Streptomyces sp. NPDC006978]|uniref:hypothetical protein n=1 Tax=Streptomyces sp. NPDC006978 TaxID=3364769 RepID=UPI00369F98A1
MTTALDRTRALLNTPPPEPIPGQLDLTRSDMTELDTILTAGLHWLYETEQPNDAWLHRGLLLTAPTANRLYGFIPANDWKRVVVAVDVAKIEWIDNGPNDLKTPANPLGVGELDALAAALRALGFEVTSTWNGHPQTTGSVGLTRTAHPSLLAAVDRYHAGCLVHPKSSVFCDCDAWRDGFNRIVQPELAAATTP